VVTTILVSRNGEVRKAENTYEVLNDVLTALLQLVPPGNVTTYKALARVLGIHPRYVGILIKKNPKPIVVPCHRVVRSDGRLGGYTLNGRKDIHFKEKLLITEGVVMRDGRVIKDFIIDNLIT